MSLELLIAGAYFLIGSMCYYQGVTWTKEHLAVIKFNKNPHVTVTTVKNEENEDQPD